MKRKLTVSALRRQWGPMYRMQEGIVPALRLNGNWLADAGFTPGEKVHVYPTTGGLWITKPVVLESRPQ